jgi:hypothetical protein
MKDPLATEQMNQRCQRIYQEHFSREVTLDGWQRMLMELVGNRASTQSRVESR